MAKVLISMKDDFLQELDKVAEGESRSRSELIREAVRLYIRSTRRPVSKVDTDVANEIESVLLQ